MTCEKHCLHWEVCKLTPPEYATAKYYTFCNCAEKCECFKDKSKYIELPCNIGDKVYHIIRKIEITEESIYRIRVYEDNHIAFSACRKGGRIVFNEDEIGKTVFLTKSEAEQKLKELKENA